VTGPVTTDMAKVRQRKRNMVDREIALHLHNYKTPRPALVECAGPIRLRQDPWHPDQKSRRSARSMRRHRGCIREPRAWNG
jgi:hypothetical protein